MKLSRNDPINLAAMKILEKWKKRKVNKEYFILQEKAWLSTKYIEVPGYNETNVCLSIDHKVVSDREDVASDVHQDLGSDWVLDYDVTKFGDENLKEAGDSIQGVKM